MRIDSIRTVLLTLLFCGWAVSSWAYSQYDFLVDGIYYTITGENTVCVCRQESSYGGDLVIPPTITKSGKTYTVTAIEDWGISQCSRVTSVQLPSTITSIGDYAFYACPNMASVNIPESVTYIGEAAFSNCTSLTGITIPGSITNINNATFSFCISLTCVEIPDSIVSVGDYAFSGCEKLSRVTFGNSVASIGSGAFALCENLDSIILPQSLTCINEWAFDQCSSLASVTFPDSIQSIGSGAFNSTQWYDSKEDGLVYIGALLYKYKGEMPNDTQLALQNGVQGIASGAFEGCDGLISISFPESVSRINSHAFAQCNGLSVVTCMAMTPPVMDNSECFDVDCYKKATLQMPHNAVKDYQNSQYWKLFADIEGIDYPFQNGNNNYLMTSDSTVAFIYKDENYYDYTGDVIIPSTVIFDGQEFTVTAIGDGALEGCELMTSVSIPNTVVTIGNNAFDACCGLDSISIPESVKTIGRQAFQGCTGLTGVTIGSAVDSIGSKAFYYCNALNDVTCLGTTPPVMESSNCFTLTAYSRATLHVPNKALQTYQNTGFWNRFVTIEGVVEQIDGDVNGDGEISVKDLAMLIDYLLGQSVLGTFHEENADFNGDGEISIKDATLLIDWLLNN